LHGSSHDLSLFGNALSIAAARSVGARTVWHLHEDLGVVTYPGRRPATQRAFAGVMRLPDALAVLSERDRAVASAHVNPEKLVVLPPTCNPDLLEVPLARNRSGDGVSTLFVGWLTAAKGIFDLLDVAESLRDTRPRITFQVLGSGMSAEETAAVAAEVDRRGLRTLVSLRGVLIGEEKRRAFAEADVLFLPTHWDAFPVVVLEAMAAGLPVVSTRVGGVPRLVEDGQGGLLGQVGDARSLAAGLERLALAPDVRLQMGGFNRHRFRTLWHPDVVGQAALDLYYRLLTGAAVSR
jgi:glycosyltransferase involved in cell wall biosynthesis